ncbi:type II CAAX endopeptidase family protein [Halostagnicola sp. A-GB9-2]|uniref:CPBP family intramembrane glutamic endopeptidase n=1 Tax=Halostagnicola sp. A-GB9-2 TaxID=3048066 RepID=UPI0024C0001A|nr:type II CAAX endopeptidase family protein [Halostagnicola sp. A-GB9-2]MDJ1432488.1 type II CAAX endopeptidase family protein [Halostagnicola sp. A-GB9-2]
MDIRAYSRWLLRGSDTSNRPRSVWRILVPIVLTVLVGGIAIPGIVSETLSLGSLSMAFVSNASFALATLGAIAVSAWYLDHRPLRAYGFSLSRAWWFDFVAGVVIGGILVGTAFIFAYSLEWVTVLEMWSTGDGSTVVGGLVLMAIVFLCVGFWEETIFRGVVVTNVAEGLRTRLSSRQALFGAWAVSTVLFGVLHLPLGTVPGEASTVGMLGVWLSLGGLLGLAYVLSGQLALPIGLHFAVNYATNSIFFGSDLFPTVLRTEITAPELWHPIAGLTMVPGLLVAFGLVIAWCYWRRGESVLAVHISERPSKTS